MLNLKRLVSLVCLGASVAGASMSPAVAQSFEEVRTERASILSHEDEIDKAAAQAAPQLGGAFSFINRGESFDSPAAAGADASQTAAQAVPEEASFLTSSEPLDSVEAASADASKTTSSAFSDVARAVSANAEKATSQNNLVSAPGLKRANLPSRGVLAGARSIPRPAPKGLTPRETKKLRSLDDFWLHQKRVVEFERPLQESSTEPAAEKQRKAVEDESQDVNLSDEDRRDPLESTEKAESDADVAPELAISAGVSGIGGEAVFKATAGYVEGNFAVEVTSQTPVGGGKTQQGIKTTIPLFDQTSLRVVAEDIWQETSLEAKLSVQALPTLNIEAGILNEGRASPLQLHVGAALDVSNLKLALKVGNLTARKSVGFEGSVESESYTFLARANDVTDATSFDIEASVQITPFIKTGVTLKNVREPVAGAWTELQVKDNMTWRLETEDFTGQPTFGTSIKFTLF